MSQGLATLGFESPSVDSSGGGGSGPSGTLIYFVLRDLDGTPTAGVDLSAAGVVKISVNGAAAVNRAGAAPTSIANGRGLYYYELDATEEVTGTINLIVFTAGYQIAFESKEIADPAQISDVTDARTLIIAALVNAADTIVAAMSAQTTTIDAHTDAAIVPVLDAIADIASPTAADIDVQLTATHGAGAWNVAAAANAAAMLAALIAWSHETDCTFGGLMIRLESALTGLATGLNGPIATWYRRGGEIAGVAFTAGLIPLSGLREESDISGSEPP